MAEVTMLFCSAEKCARCVWTEASAGCLRRQAELSTGLSKRVLNRRLHDALEELGLELMNEARLIDKEQMVSLVPFTPN